MHPRSGPPTIAASALPSSCLLLSAAILAGAALVGGAPTPLAAFAIARCTIREEPMLRACGRVAIRTGRISSTSSLSRILAEMSSRKRPLPASSMRCSASDTNSEPPEEQSYRPLVIVLAGPTAVGKSDVAAELCSPLMAGGITRGHFSSNAHATANEDATGNIAIRGHVVSADSVQAYRGVDIGANKPTIEERERTPHHLVDVVDPPTDLSAASYNAADWMRDAEYVIRKLTSYEAEEGEEQGEEGKDRNALSRRDAIDRALSESLASSKGSCMPDGAHRTILPVVVGGTMMYLQWLVRGRPDAIRPTNEAVERAADKIDGYKREADNAVVGELNAPTTGPKEDDEGTNDGASDVVAWSAASSYVSSLGPVFAQRVQKLPGRDWYRLRRLLEVAYTVASKKSAQDDTHKSEEEILRDLTDQEVYTGIRSGSLPDAGYDVRCFFLCPDERMAHFHTVDQRCEQMLLRGLLRETAALYASGGLPEESQVTRAIGYRQTLEYLRRKGAKRNDSGAFLQFVGDFATATRQYAKKQMQWFRRDAAFAFIPVQMERDKAERSAEAARIIGNMCQFSLEAFNAELSSNGTDDELPLSARTKLDNERQGKKMKVFMSKRKLLIEGSDAFVSVLNEADECTKKVQRLGDEF